MYIHTCTYTFEFYVTSFYLIHKYMKPSNVAMSLLQAIYY